MVKFLRRVWYRHSKLGKGRKNKQKWRNPTGRHNKMRLKRKGYQTVVSIGYKSPSKELGLIEGKNPVQVSNVKDLAKIKKNEIGIVGNVGIRKKIEIAKEAKEKKIKIYNLNPESFLKKLKKLEKNKK